ncbi:DUF1294 domain-containing protein [Opitutus sp. GAS368]|uniref:DUF1294 domain-containing protein n=1 Tax=Opitutus sp. GAS368 TaxID=1882749 RepID=UPI000879C818|nr:DUF1294 domain-containing protein [Opitutus sp. GAS368]SDS06174.1 Uncharacterized membrane protein YsdA, DUF1294 family [Opitutus sp. GAS368]
MSEAEVRQILSGWIIAASAWTFVLFGFDKWRARRGGGRVAEASLFWASALGGWPGGLLGILVFRHKSAKGSFQLKFAAAFFIWAALVYAAVRLM